MTNASVIRKFASDACQVIEACQSFIGELKAELDSKNAQLAKQASAGAFSDEAALKKAASAVHAVYGSPSNISVDDIANAWKANPGYTIGIINKLASELQNRSAAAADNLGTRIGKRASASTRELSADDILRNKYSK